MHLSRSTVLSVGLAFVAWGTSPTVPVHGADASPSPTPSVGVCALPPMPSPGAEPSAAPTPDVAHGHDGTLGLSVGVFSLCLTDGTRASGTVACTWNARRDSIVGIVTASRITLDGQRWWAGLYPTVVAGPTPAAVFRLQPSRGHAHPYLSAPDGSLQVTLPAAAQGSAAFTAVTDQLRQPASRSGVLAWDCGEAPEPPPGMTGGSMTFTLGAPHAGTFTTRASCIWVDRPEGRAVSSVSGMADAVPLGDGVHTVAMSAWIARDARGPSIGTELRVDDVRPRGGRSRTFADDVSALGLERAPDDSTARIRVLGLTPWPAHAGASRQAADPTALQALLEWTCDGPPTTSAEPDPNQAHQLIPGTTTLRVAGPSGATFTAASSCRIVRLGDRRVADERLSSFELDGLEARLVALPAYQRAFLLMLLAPDGTYRGEYVARAADTTGWTERIDGSGETSVLTFVPGSLVAPPPLFGASVAGPFQATVAWTCPDPAASPSPVGGPGASPAG